MAKLPGKTLYSGRRRAMVRKSGYHVKPGSTGGDYKVIAVKPIIVPAGVALAIKFHLPAFPTGVFVGFGGYFAAPASVQCSFVFSGASPADMSTPQPCMPNWSKVGAMWQSTGVEADITFLISAPSAMSVAIWDMNCGSIEHKHMTGARPELLVNMKDFSPEAHFYKSKGQVNISLSSGSKVAMSPETVPLYLKSCNRCGRFLPINVIDERKHLSFTNHCVAEHRRPCSHTGFGKLKDVKTGEFLQLQYGYQLECRYCKKFEVNAAHNPQRTASQMKEDAARRRAIELLLAGLYGGSPQLLYRHQTGRELADDIWKRFKKRCFKCNTALPTAKKMHLDHTRPLALLWPLDDTATALCESCNSQKRDRPPIEYYDDAALAVLSKITGIPLPELKDPSPNMEAVSMLLDRLDWFFDDFLSKPELTKERDGKVAGELLVKALQKTINKAKGSYINLQHEFEVRRSSK